MTTCETSDAQLLELLRRHGAMSVAQVAEATSVTATAVRQRLSRLMSQRLVERQTQRQGRGRPVHRYSLTEKARLQGGANYADLAIALWKEVRAITDPEIRRGLLKRLASALAEHYRPQVRGTMVADRMESLKELYGDRRIPVDVEGTSDLPVLTVVDCPYPDLPEEDAGICALEKLMLSDLLQAPVRLSQCRLDGHPCCQFETS